MTKKLKNKKIYFILNQRAKQIKIGVSYDPSNRLKQVQTGSGDKLKLLFTLKSYRVTNNYEKVLHEFFEGYRLEGEWFSWNNFVMRKIGRLYENYFLDDGYIDKPKNHEFGTSYNKKEFKSTILTHLEDL